MIIYSPLDGEALRPAAQTLIGSEGLDARAKNSVERLAASF